MANMTDALPTFGRRAALLALSSAMLSAKLARADDCPEPRFEKALHDIAEARATVTTLTGPFTQERKIGLLAAKVRSTGTMTLVRPDRLRWELAAPDDAVYWILPEGLAYKNKTSQGRVAGTGDKIAAALDDLRILLGGDLARLRDRYDLTGSCNGEDPIVFSAVPKAGHVTPATKIVFALAPDLVSPKSVTLTFGPRDQTDITFGAMQKNAAVDPAKMRPPG
jgi:outer membrane lipoprotein-sorting protein